jgi:peptidoglycan/LPS O-acetylase OafA/YrhL
MILDRIRRVTRDGRWIPEIDGLRFIAIISVILFHLDGEIRVRSGVHLPMEPRYKALFWAINNGDRGVELFFVISGMILAMPFARYYLAKGKEVSLRKYYMRRVTRLEPPYILSMILFSAMLAIYMHGRLTPHYGLHALASTFYLHNLIYGVMSPVNPVTWSLEVEIQFYAIAPLVMMLFRIPGKMFRRTLLGVLVIGIGLAQTPWNQSLIAPLNILFHLQYFIAGLLLADIFVLDLPEMKTHRMWDLGALLALVYMFATKRETWSAHLLLPYFFVVICLAAMRSVIFRKFVSNPWIAVIGGMCYSIYLLHFALMAVFFKLSRRLLLFRFDYLTNYMIQIFVVGVPILLFSVAFFMLVERPCMDPNWPGKLWHKLTGRTEHDVDVLDTAGVSEETEPASVAR